MKARKHVKRVAVQPEGRQWLGTIRLAVKKALDGGAKVHEVWEAVAGGAVEARHILMAQAAQAAADAVGEVYRAPGPRASVWT